MAQVGGQELQLSVPIKKVLSLQAEQRREEELVAGSTADMLHSRQEGSAEVKVTQVVLQSQIPAPFLKYPALHVMQTPPAVQLSQFTGQSMQES